ncbi:DUF6907 domain-containing protein [Streptomyces sp. NPDC008061]|uniref:DUF6907 domain-containing protein n=1 Tax=Streptomyces sp. NPDC008061 TaxID=3364805 RepID=UPI0036F0C3C3
MQNTVPASFKPSGALIPEQPTEAWRSMTTGDVSTTPINELLNTLGVRIVEVEPGDLATDGIAGYFSGRVGDGEIQIERTLPQADRESVVRELLARITPTDQQYSKKATTPARLRPAKVREGRIYIECPAWCTKDHVYDGETALIDVYHSGDPVDLMVPHLGEDAQPLVHVRLNADTFATDVPLQAPMLVVDDETDTFHMSPEQGLKFADDLIAFAEQVRAMATRIAR